MTNLSVPLEELEAISRFLHRNYDDHFAALGTCGVDRELDPQGHEELSLRRFVDHVDRAIAGDREHRAIRAALKAGHDA